MKIVIDIDEDYYEIIKYNVNVEHNDFKPYALIANGIPLPKGHGDLIDVGQCDKKLFYQQCGGADSLITVKSAYDMILLLPPIIEAERKKNDRRNF